LGWTDGQLWRFLSAFLFRIEGPWKFNASFLGVLAGLGRLWPVFGNLWPVFGRVWPASGRFLAGCKWLVL
jgi:hypothetical protein